MVLSTFVRECAVVSLLVLGAVAFAPGGVFAQSCTPPTEVTCSPGGFVSCGASASYAAGTIISTLPSPLNAVGTPMGQLLKCFADGVEVPTSQLRLGSALNCPGALAAAREVSVCYCGTCTTPKDLMPAIGFCTAVQTPVVSCAITNTSCFAGQTMTPLSYGCTSSIPSTSLRIDGKPSIPCKEDVDVHLITAVSPLGCYSVGNTGVFSYVAEVVDPQDPCSACALQPGYNCYQTCCLRTGDVQITLEWEGSADLDLELSNTGCVVNETVPTGTTSCRVSQGLRGPISAAMDRVAGAEDAGDCAGKKVENIYIPRDLLGTQRIFSINVKSKGIMRTVNYSLRMLMLDKEFVQTGSVSPSWRTGSHTLWYSASG